MKPKTSKEQIQELLSSDNSNIWDILTALRGPDTSGIHGATKRATTAVIRHAIGLTPHNNYGCVSGPDDKHQLAVRMDMYQRISNSAYWVSFHFYQHAYAAFSALGLKWLEINK